MRYKISMIEQKPKECKKESLIDINEFKNMTIKERISTMLNRDFDGE